MKHWFLTRLLGARLKKLQQPMDPAFAAALKNKLHRQAQTILYPQNNMRRNSFAYLTALLLIAVAGYIFLPYNNAPTPEEVIQNASAAYEDDSNRIYHEKLLVQRYENDVLVDASLQESWINRYTNESLSTYRDPKTNTLTKAFGTNLQGDSYGYPVPETNSDESEASKQWKATFAGDKYVCKLSEEKNGITAAVILQVAADDFTVHTTSAYSYETAMPPEQEDENASKEVIKNIMEAIESSTDSKTTYTVVNDDGKKYYVFTQALHDGQTVEDYFDETDFHLAKRIVRGVDVRDFSSDEGNAPKNTYTLYDYQIAEYLNAEENQNVFDFSPYNMTLTSEISANPMPITAEDGCYKPGKEKMSDEEKENFLQQLAADTVNEWKNYPKTIFENKELEQEKNQETKDEWIAPAEGLITQSFHEGHYGIDIANETENTPIVAIAAGTVIKTEDGWNGGYGNCITIDHGNGYTSVYAHLQEFNVKLGDTVDQGQQIGIMGHTGRVFGNPGTHVHFEMLFNEEKIDPITLINF